MLRGPLDNKEAKFMEFFVSPYTHPSYRSIQKLTADGIFEKDEFAKYIYDNLESYLKTERYINWIVSSYKALYAKFNMFFNKFVKHANDPMWWGDRSSSIVKVIATEADGLISRLDSYRKMTLTNFITETWADARAFDKDISLSRDSYAYITYHLFVIEQFHQDVKNTFGNLLDLRRSILDISRTNFFNRIENYQLYNTYDKMIVFIDKVIEAYINCSNLKEEVEKIYAKRI